MIQELSPELANQIAAGEVVERPLSVIKELVENALDAGADTIIVDIQDGGMTSMSVQDNGEGIAFQDLCLIPKKHATSKIASLEDLQKVMTFGFRGEALASISSVSDFEIITKHTRDVSGKRLFFQEREKKIQDIAFEKGTKVVVKNLFHKTPARLNYIKSQRTEYNHILEYIQSIALFYPTVSFTLISDEKRSFFSPKTSQEERIKTIYSEELFNNLLLLDFEIHGVHISGYISDPKVHFPQKNRQILSVNKRLIKSPLLYRALQDAYNRYIPHGSFPAYILSLDLDPTQIDANVHPRKLELRFANEQDIYRSLYHGISGRLESVDLIQSSSYGLGNSPELSKGKNNYYTGSGTKFQAYSPYTQKIAHPKQSGLDFTKALLGFGEEETKTDISYIEDLKILGQLWNSYIVVEKGKKMILFDQHALAERVNYEKLLAKKGGNSIQRLLLSETIHITPHEKDTIEQYQDILREMGFDIEFMGNHSLLINSIPDIIKKEDIKEIFLAIISDIQAGNIEKIHSFEEVRNKIFAYTACRSAIKFGHRLSEFEMKHLIQDGQSNYSATCPHGRPVIMEIDMDELKGSFDR